MTGQRTLPGLGLSAYWTKGTGNWDLQHDPDTRMLSALVQCHVKSRTALPGSPVDGDMYISPPAASNPHQVMIRDAGAWVYYVPQKGWWIWVEDAEQYVRWSGTAWVPFLPGTVLPALGAPGTVLKVNAGATGLVWGTDLNTGGGGGEGGGLDPLYEAHQFWRLRITDASTGNPFMRIGDFRIEAASGDRLAPEAGGTASSATSSPNNAFDNSLSSQWDTAGLASNGPASLIWDFGSGNGQTPRRFRIYPVESEGNVLRGFSLAYSDDGVSYVDFYTHTAGEDDPLDNDEYWTYELPPIPYVPAGGTAGMILAKRSGANYDTEWINPPTGESGEEPRTPHRYWRILPTSQNGGNDYIHAAEIAFRGSPGGANLIGSGTAIASGNYGSDVPANVFDGDNTTRWESQGGNVSGGTVWIGYDFGAGNVVDVREVAFTLTLGYENDERITSGKLQWSDTGTVWNDSFVLAVAAWVGDSGYQTQVWTDPSLFELRTDVNAAISVTAADRGKTVVGNRASGQVATLPVTATANWLPGDTVTFIQQGAGQVSVVGAAGVTVNKPDDFDAKIRHQWGIATAIYIAADTWVLTGALADV